MNEWQHGFYRLPLSQRQALLASQVGITDTELNEVKKRASQHGDQMVENYITDFGLPEGLALHLVVNQREYLVPMVVEEPSVIAAESHGAQMIAKAGGFSAPTEPRRMVGQVVLGQVEDPKRVTTVVLQNKARIIDIANQAHPSMKKRGAGAKTLEIRNIGEGYVSVDLIIDVGEAMGANTVNTMCEAVAAFFEKQGYQVVTAILSNLATQSVQTATCEIPLVELGTGGVDGKLVGQKIEQLSQLAQIDPYRATTHNKGIMNGIDAVMIATGNDWRAIESGAHAFAAVDGQYRGLSQWRVNGDCLSGIIKIPLPVGTVGGSIGIVPLVKLNQRVMGIKSADELAAVTASLGLAQNLAALTALATTGIQTGHMKLQYRSLAVTVGAKPSEVAPLVKRLMKQKSVDQQIAVNELNKLRKGQGNGRN